MTATCTADTRPHPRDYRDDRQPCGAPATWMQTARFYPDTVDGPQYRTRGLCDKHRSRVLHLDADEFVRVAK